jgi:ATP-dependent DNA ligase
MQTKVKPRFFHSTLDAHNYRGQPFLYAHEKIDGHRLTIFRQPDGELAARTRNNNPVDISKFAWISRVDKIPPCTSLDGEIFVPGKPASFVPTALTNPKFHHLLQFSVFAIPYLAGHRQFAESLEWMADTCAYYGLQYSPFMRYAAMPSVAELLEMAEWKNIEGWVLKRSNYCQWYKLKRVKTIDAFVTGFIPGKGKYSKYVGSLRVSVIDQRNGKITEIATVGGMDERTRFAIEPDADLDRVCEVAYQCVSSGGRLRHPRFLRWRTDKSKDQCVSSQDCEL